MSKNLIQLLTRSSVLMVARVAGGGVAFAANIMIARWYGAEALGIFALCMALTSLIAVILPLGLQSVGVMFVSEYSDQKQHGLVRGYIRTGYRNIAIVTVIAVVLLAGAAVIADRFGYYDHWTAAMFAILIAPALAMINFNCSVLTGCSRQLHGLMPDLLIKPALMFIAIAAVAFVVTGASPTVLLTTVCICIWLTALAHLWILLKETSVSNPPPAEVERRRWRKAGTPWIFITLMWDYFIELHLIMAGMLTTSAELGLLHICFRLRVLAGFGVRALSSLVMPGVYAANAKDDIPGIERGLFKANVLSLAFCLCVCAGLAVFGEFFLGLVNEKFRSGYTILMIITVAMLPRPIFGPATAVMAMRGLQVPVVWILLVGIALTVALSLVMFPIYGIEGIAIAYLISSTFIAVAQWWWAKVKTGIDCSIVSLALSRLNRRRAAAPKSTAAVPGTAD